MNSDTMSIEALLKVNRELQAKIDQLEAEAKWREDHLGTPPDSLVELATSILSLAAYHYDDGEWKGMGTFLGKGLEVEAARQIENWISQQGTQKLVTDVLLSDAFIEKVAKAFCNQPLPEVRELTFGLPPEEIKTGAIIPTQTSTLPQNNHWTQDYSGKWHWGGDTHGSYTACGRSIAGTPLVDRAAKDLSVIEDYHGDDVCSLCHNLRELEERSAKIGAN